MRYKDIDNIVFNDNYGNEYSVKDIRPIAEFLTGKEIKPLAGYKIDEIIVDEENYGPDSESMVYTVAEHNAEKLAEHNFDLGRLKKIKIPVVDEL